jgi:hypothetical protein
MKKRSGNMSSGRRNKKSRSKRCKESYSIKRRQQERAFQAHYPKAAASGDGSLLLNKLKAYHEQLVILTENKKELQLSFGVYIFIIGLSASAHFA